MRSTLLDPGALRSELRLQTCMSTSDAAGGLIEDWIETAVVFGLIEPVAATSIFGAAQALETVTHRVVIRARSGVRSQMRFVRQDRIFVIVTVHDPDETGRYLTCMTREEGA